jgi:hypothetical protein
MKVDDYFTKAAGNGSFGTRKAASGTKFPSSILAAS